MRWMLIAALALAGSACGKKGPPLAPFVRIPAAVDTIEARRVGDDVYVALSVPAQNVDGSTPADVRRVDVYGYTAAAPAPRGRVPEAATIVATVDVAAPPRAGEPPAEDPGIVPGTRVTVRDPLEADDLVPVPPAGVSGSPGPAGTGISRRFYSAIAFSARGVPGPQGAVAELTLTRLPDPPAALVVTHSADAVMLAWEPPGGLAAFLLDRALPPDPPPPGIAALAPGASELPPAEGPIRYNVYREIAPDPLVLPTGGSAASEAAPVPVNPMPIAVRTFTEPLQLDERERCYTVRTVRGAEPPLVEGPTSPRACVTPLDVFAPAAPTGLAAIASADAISLIWEPVVDGDLAGYLVLRGDAGGDTLAPLTPDPIREAQFTDESVMPGVRYVYHVIAVDSRLPLPNASPPAMIEETAR
jgi:hypothetical protein